LQEEGLRSFKRINSLLDNFLLFRLQINTMNREEKFIISPINLRYQSVKEPMPINDNFRNIIKPLTNISMGVILLPVWALVLLQFYIYLA
jgi:hypothetical protein